MEMGKWLELLEEALQDIDKARAHAVERRLFAAAEDSDEGEDEVDGFVVVQKKDAER